MVSAGALTLSGCGLNPELVTSWFETGSAHPAAPLIVITVFICSGFVAAPLSVVMVPTILVFGPVTGVLLTLIGASLSGALFFALGSTGSSLVGRATARLSFAGAMTRLLRTDGVFAVAVARNLPLGPYPLVNLALGASPVRFFDFLIGNLIGLLPWVLLYAFTGSQLRSLLEDPDPRTAALFALGIVTIAAMTVLIARRASSLISRRRSSIEVTENQERAIKGCTAPPRRPIS